MAEPMEVFGRRLGNRWCIQPMEGWDGTPEGQPTEWTRRRWENFGRSGAKFIWGGEAVAVRHDGRANPNQLWLTPATQGAIAGLREALLAAHRAAIKHPPQPPLGKGGRGTGPEAGAGAEGGADAGPAISDEDPIIGLQLTHSGRYCKPNDNTRMEPRIAYHHPILDARLGIKPDDDSAIMSDDDLYRLMDDYVVAAQRTAAMGFDFVDLKCCHGYLGHELLGAHTRPGPFGGSFENRTRFIRELIERVRAAAPGLHIGVRVSAFDIVPFEDDPATRVGRKKGAGRPSAFAHLLPYRYGFGVNIDNPLEYDLTEPLRLMALFESLGVSAINITAGSPYYNPHIQRPAFYPPSDGYQPPEDPLIGVARQINAVRQLKAAFPRLVLAGSAYTYLQEMLPVVAQAVVRAGWVDFVGVGRMVLSYPEMPRDTLTRGAVDAKQICRTFSDCTTGPRKGLISGCFPLDDAYKNSEPGQKLREIKRGEA
jgi:2,4-dienoyl-CoA reductase-like NADH-dependent reductase (Old Yellow Enzyme family)